MLMLISKCRVEISFIQTPLEGHAAHISDTATNRRHRMNKAANTQDTMVYQFKVGTTTVVKLW